MRARRSLALRAIDDCILSVVDKHDDCEIREFSNRSLARGVQDLRETVVVVGRCRDSALECARRLAALGGAKVRQDTPRYAKDSLTVYQLHILWMDGWM